MTRSRLLLATALLVGLGLGVIATKAHAQIGLTIKPETLRFRLVAYEPIAAPDGKSAVNGWQIAVFRDAKAGDQCYIAFLSGSAMSMTGPGICP